MRCFLHIHQISFHIPIAIASGAFTFFFFFVLTLTSNIANFLFLAYYVNYIYVLKQVGGGIYRVY